jgi:ureidoglycolate lyase
MHLSIEPFTADAFAPFGGIIVPPAGAGRDYFDAPLASRRGHAGPSLSVARIEAVASLPLTADRMERHPFSSQSFVPMGPEQYLVVVAPHGADGGPDIARARAFVPDPYVGITYGPDVWHHPMTVLAAPARFAILMWNDGTDGDVEIVAVPPFTVG